MSESVEAMPGYVGSKDGLALEQWMPLQEATRLAKLWTTGCDFDNAPQWRAVVRVLLDEMNRQSAYKSAAEHAAQADARIAALEAALAKSERCAIAYSDVIANQCYVGEGSVPAIAWIENTLCGPGLLPEHEAAQAMGGAQAWFDAKMAEHAAFRAAHSGPAAPARAALGPKA